MIKILQIATVAMFVLVVGTGLAILFFATDKIAAYGSLIGTIWPLFVAEVIPALIGKPLTEAVRNLTAKPGTP
jgi:hypothetical protein